MDGVSETDQQRIFNVTASRAGEVFLLSLWLQGQMSDLLVLHEHRELIAPFVADPAVMPAEFVQLRTAAWERDFAPVAADFIAAFGGDIEQQDRADLTYLGALRNAIAHAHVSIARPYLLYRPQQAREGRVLDALKVQPRSGASEPPLLKLDFTDDARYLGDFERIARLDRGCFARVAASVGVPHSRIR